jgi:tetratricopeptide (TPR) repeat protein
MWGASAFAQADVEQLIRDGIAFYDQGLFDEAIGNFETVLEQDPDNGTAIY